MMADRHPPSVCAAPVNSSGEERRPRQDRNRRATAYGAALGPSTRSSPTCGPPFEQGLHQGGFRPSPRWFLFRMPHRLAKETSTAAKPPMDFRLRH